MPAATEVDGAEVYRHRLFCILGGEVSEEALHLAQHYTEALAAASRDSSRSASSSATLLPGVQPLRKALDVLQQHHRQTGETPLQSGEDGAWSLRNALQRDLGDAAGSAVYREWIAVPRDHLRRVAAGLAAAVQQRYIPLLRQATPLSSATAEEGEEEEELDIHVQFFPASSTPPLQVPHGFCACITVRRLSDLHELVDAAAQLQRTYLSVAAAGQTLSNTLSFWDAVSYGDEVPPELAAYPPLPLREASAGLMHRRAGGSFEEGETASRRGAPGAKRRSDGEDEEGLRRRLHRDDADNDDGDGDCQPLILGMDGGRVPQVRGPYRVDWVQPPALLAADAVSPHRSHRAAKQVRYESSGLLAVIYVSLSGTAYVGFPYPPTEKGEDTSANAAIQTASAEDTMPSSPRSLPSKRTGEIVTCALPLNSASSFTRGLLGLS